MNTASKPTAEVALLLVVLIASALRADEPVTKHYPDGTPRAIYRVDSEGHRHGCSHVLPYRPVEQDVGEGNVATEKARKATAWVGSRCENDTMKTTIGWCQARCDP